MKIHLVPVWWDRQVLTREWDSQNCVHHGRLDIVALSLRDSMLVTFCSCVACVCVMIHYEKTSCENSFSRHESPPSWPSLALFSMVWYEWLHFAANKFQMFKQIQIANILSDAGVWSSIWGFLGLRNLIFRISIWIEEYTFWIPRIWVKKSIVSIFI